jgi:DNA-binding NarL/FixJ family response regulator
MRGVRERLLAEGFDGYVVKPIVDEEELLATIARLLETSVSPNPSATPAVPPTPPSAATGDRTSGAK